MPQIPNRSNLNSASGQQPIPTYPGTSKKNDKYTMIGRPYRVKTKLPFYDGKGVYQGVKIPPPASGTASGTTSGSGALHKKLHQFEIAYNSTSMGGNQNLAQDKLGYQTQ